MVTNEKVYNTELIKYRLRIILIWFGVLTWLLFFILRIAGEKPSLFWYLPFHLAGVIGGSRLRAFARKEMNLSPSKKNVLQILGHEVIFGGFWCAYRTFI